MAAARGLASLVLGGTLLLAAGCAEDPRPARRATAIDVAGAWLEHREDGAVGATLRIEHEDGIVDVVATVQGRTVGGAEVEALGRVSDAAERAALAERLILGAGRDLVRIETDGGENVSFDGGRTTTLQVQSAPVPVTASSPAARDATLSWALRLDGDHDALAGSIAVVVSEVVPRPGEVDGFARETSRIEVPLRVVRQGE